MSVNLLRTRALEGPCDGATGQASSAVAALKLTLGPVSIVRAGQLEELAARPLVVRDIGAELVGTTFRRQRRRGAR